MKFWLLHPAKNLKMGDNPWDPWYDKIFGFVIRAETAVSARKIANDNAEDENRTNIKSPWLNPVYSTCTEITSKGDTCIIISDRRPG